MTAVVVILVFLMISTLILSEIESDFRIRRELFKANFVRNLIIAIIFIGVIDIGFMLYFILQ